MSAAVVAVVEVPVAVCSTEEAVSVTRKPVLAEVPCSTEEEREAGVLAVLD